MHPALHGLLSQHPGRMAEGGAVDDGDGEQMPDGLHEIAAELISAVHAGDPAKVAECLEDAFEMLEMMPHSEAEAPHEEE